MRDDGRATLRRKAASDGVTLRLFRSAGDNCGMTMLNYRHLHYFWVVAVRADRTLTHRAD